MVEYEYHRDSTEQETKEIQDETAVPEDLSVQTKTKKKELSGGPDPYRLIKEGGIVIGMEKCGKRKRSITLQTIPIPLQSVRHVLERQGHWYCSPSV